MAIRPRYICTRSNNTLRIKKRRRAALRRRHRPPAQYAYYPTKKALSCQFDSCGKYGEKAKFFRRAGARAASPCAHRAGFSLRDSTKQHLCTGMKFSQNLYKRRRPAPARGPAAGPAFPARRLHKTSTRRTDFFQAGFSLGVYSVHNGSNSREPRSGRLTPPERHKPEPHPITHRRCILWMRNALP